MAASNWACVGGMVQDKGYGYDLVFFAWHARAHPPRLVLVKMLSAAYIIPLVHPTVMCL